MYKNVKYLSKKIGKTFPIFRGNERIVESEGEPYHGNDGLGDWPGRQNDEEKLGVNAAEKIDQEER